MKKILQTLTIAVTLGLTGCNDSYLERLPTTEVTEATAFTSFTTCSNYLTNLYQMFSGGYTSFQGPAMVSGALGTSTRDIYSGILTNYGSGVGNIPNSYANQTVTIPTSDGTYSNPYTWIRWANIMLEHINEPSCTDQERLHLEAVARFFRAYAHYSLLINYGDAIYVDHLLSDASEELTKSRDSRLYVADQIYKELDWCIKNVQDQLAEPNMLNSDVMKAFMSRFTLFEGTWRKYHNVNETECSSKGYITGAELLQACATVSKELITKHPNLYKGNSQDVHPGKGWGEMWTTEDLQGVPGVLLYVKYVENYKMHRLGHFEHIGSASLEMPQSTVDLYLTKEGLPIHNRNVKHYDYDPVSKSYTEGADYDYANCNVYRTFRMRDPRMWQTVMPPYHIIGGGDANTYRMDESCDGIWMEYLNQFAPRGIYNAAEGTYRIPNWASGYHLTPYHKALPSSNWAGNYLRNVPTVQTSNFQNNESAAAGIQLIYSGSGFQRGKSGYFVWKHHASWDKQDQNHPMEVSDKPVFKIEEVMLNYAEVMFELGKFDQSVADLTINKLRDRAEVGLMRVSEIGSDFDPDRDPSVEPVLWEIRRERLIELMGESFSWEDVRRWKKADYFVNKQHYGVYLDNVTGTFNNNKATTGGTGILNSDTKKEASDAELAAIGNCGHLYYYLDPVSAGKGWLDKYYLRPIPSDELLLNDNLEQQEAWK
ncbi:RagB/SusD family nutrient uptake outer membrane protein [uncultured Bacteroides sp.]|uniref:RagB/SusD family nutrient uptake outer membrane protein n=1 Tax=uncultured Bacteroides sp. TaxID=162156 RepID=UPI0025A95F2D|nr:RagB/SusD family nutrient uptake outer membrane protein [uncultured Bacteroides sp.]